MNAKTEMPGQEADRLFDQLVELVRASRQGKDVGRQIEETVGRLVEFEKAHPECGTRTMIHAQPAAS